MAGRPKNASRCAAIDAGARHYIGKPCKRGHIGLRFASTRACVECSGGNAAALKTGFRAVILEVL